MTEEGVTRVTTVSPRHPPTRPPAPPGYDGLIIVLYVISGLVLVSLALAVWLAVTLKKDEAGAAGWMGR